MLFTYPISPCPTPVSPVSAVSRTNVTMELLKPIAATLAAKRKIDVIITRRTPNLSIRMPTSGTENADARAHKAIADEIEARSQPNSASSGLIKTPNEKRLIAPLTTISPMQEPNGIHHTDGPEALVDSCWCVICNHCFAFEGR